MFKFLLQWCNAKPTVLDSRRSVIKVCQMSSTSKKREIAVLMLLKATVKETQNVSSEHVFTDYLIQNRTPEAGSQIQ